MTDVVALQLVTNQRSFQLMGSSYVIQESCGIFGGFSSGSSSSQLPTFASIPASILESFRVIHVLNPRFDVVLTAYLQLMHFDHPSLIALKLQLFFDDVSSLQINETFSVQ